LAKEELLLNYSRIASPEEARNSFVGRQYPYTSSESYGDLRQMELSVIEVDG